MAIPSLANGASGAVARAKINYLIGSVINVKDSAYGATGDGVTNDAGAINAAIDAAFTAGSSSQGVNFGAVVFFPPGIYQCNTKIDFTGKGVGSISLVGSGRHCTRIQGSMAGYLIDKPNDSAQNLERIQDLWIYNSRENVDAGAVRWCSVENGLMKGCLIQGMIGIDLTNNVFSTSLENTKFTGLGGCVLPGSIGIACQQIGIYNCGITLWSVGVAASNTGFFMSGTRTEVCEIGWLMGRSLDQSTHALNDDTISAWSILGSQTERCNSGLVVIAGSAGLVAGNLFSGTVGVYKTIASISWSSAGGGTVSVVTDYPHNIENGKTAVIEACTPSGYNVAATATVSSATAFTYPLVSDPGTISVKGLAMPRESRCIGIRSCNTSVFESNAITSTNLVYAGVDLIYDDFPGGKNNTFISMNAGSWLAPVSAMKASYKYINCDNPTNMVFADLPQESGVYMDTRREGMEYEITDGTIAGGVWGGTVTGGGSTHTKVRYNGTNWTAMGI